jgi:2-oxoglutarate ferredoxin oxidoreductase subunit beta
MINSNQYNTTCPPTWCPGCGNFGVFAALKQALVKLNLQPHGVMVVTDIGCAGNMADFVNTYVFHSLHGRALPVATGIKLANHNLPVIAVLGDGACYGEGLNHFINLMRGNHDLTVLVTDNYLYSLTTGQYSPTTPKGTVTKTTPNGSIEEPLNPLALALANHTTFCSRGYAFEIQHLTDLIVQAIQHKGFSLVDILQPCVTLNKNQTLSWYKEKVYKLPAVFQTKEEAMKEAQRTDKLGIGLFYEQQKPSYQEEDVTLKVKPLIDKDISNVNISELVKEFV